MKLLYIFKALFVSCIITSCSLNEDAGLNNNSEETVVGFDGTFIQEDRIGRPLINAIFINGNRKQDFNVAVTATMNENFKGEMEAELRRISPAYNNATDTNILGQNASDLANLLATDVLNISLVEQTSFFDASRDVMFTGRALGEDVMDAELLLIFGGENGMENPSLRSDFVIGNDRDFQSSFPYLPRPW